MPPRCLAAMLNCAQPEELKQTMLNCAQPGELEQTMQYNHERQYVVAVT